MKGKRSECACRRDGKQVERAHAYEGFTYGDNFFAICSPQVLPKKLPDHGRGLATPSLLEDTTTAQDKY